MMPVWAQVLIAVLASSVLATIAGKLLDIWLYKIKHKDDVVAQEDGDLRDDVKAVSSQVDKLAGTVSALSGQVDTLVARRDEDNAKQQRMRILRFGDELRHGILHSQEHFVQIMADITQYEAYCTQHPDFVNRSTVATTSIITATYQKCLEENKFLEYEIDATRDEDIKDDIKAIRATVDALCNNSLSETYIAIRQTASAYIKRGRVTLWQKQQLQERYQNYLRLPGAQSGLEIFFVQVERCRTIADDEVSGLDTGR